MNDNQNTHDDRFEPTREQQILSDRALGEIEADFDDWREPDEYELAAAQLAVAYAERESQSMPSSLRHKLRAMADQAIQETPKPAPASPKPALSLTGHDAGARHAETKATAYPSSDRSSLGSKALFNSAGWLAAAAAITIAAIGWMQPSATNPNRDPIAVQTVDEKLAALESQPGTVSADWFAWPAGTLAPDTPHRPAADDVTGRFVWNESLQEGYMVFENMPVNDPKLEQYQLWLVSADQEHPIDGGVFDVASNGRVIVPIDPKLRATNLAALGVTVEKPGGVVVSSREDRLVASLVPQG